MSLDSPTRTTDLTLALPGDWWQVPLESADGGVASIREYVARTAGSRDDQAQLRHDLRQHLTNAATEARTGGGVSMYLLRELAPGVAIPITLTTFQKQLPLRLSDEIGVGVATESLASTLRRDAPDNVITAYSKDGLGVVRDLRLKLLTSETGDQEYLVRADYWLLRDHPHEPWLLAFGSPLITAEELQPLGDFMDAIARTASWEPSIS